MKQKQIKKPPISPDKYKQELKSVQLKQIRLESCSAKLRREKLERTEGPINVDVSTKASYVIADQTTAIITEQFLLVGTKATKRDYAIRIECTLSVTITKSQGTFTKGFLDTYLMVNLNLISWPYFREFVHNITQRMGIPPLILPFLKMP